MAITAALGAMLVFASSALAGPVALDAPGNGNPPLTAYDPGTATAYVAWSAQPANTGIDVCVLPPGAAACDGGSPVLLTDPEFTGDNVPVLTGLRVMPNGEVVVLGEAGDTGTVTWASAPGGGGFFAAGNGLQNSGHTISALNSFYEPDDVVPVSNTDLATLDIEHNGFGVAAYNVSGSSSGTSADASANFDSPDCCTEDAPQIAAQADPDGSGRQIVVTAGDNDTNYVPPGCPNSIATGFGVRVASTANLNSATVPTYQLLACSAESPVLTGGGTSGIGAVDQEGSSIDGTGSGIEIDFHAFNPTTDTFGGSIPISDESAETLAFVGDIDAADDSGNGVYALWGDDRGEVLDYSADGGQSWGPPVVTPAADDDDDNMAPVGGGSTLIAWDANAGSGTQVFLQEVNYQSLLPGPPQPAATSVSSTQSWSSGGWHMSGASIAIPTGAVGETDQAILSGANVGSAGGGVTYTLYSSSTCSASSQVFSSGPDPVTNGTAAPSGAVGELPQGTYYWQISYTGDSLNSSGTGACGPGGEVLTVEPLLETLQQASTNGSTLALPVHCTTPPCTFTVSITIKVNVEVTIASKHRRRKAITLTLAKGRFTLTKAGTHTVTIKLTPRASAYVKAHHTLHPTLTIADSVDGHGEQTSRTITLKYVKPKPRRR
ncbi:MAG TPA: hypothetical protein VMF57_03915 [Solirubrobacteraceae bacterium]|nr:hypothetical protein [Solirubrobacteraceae bacterium]